jgi:hypothetical protein
VLKAADPASKIAPYPDEKIDGKPHAVIRLESPYGAAVTLYIDKKTKLLSRIGFADSASAPGSSVSQVEEFADYKDVKGIKYPHKQKSTTQGRVTNLEIDKVELDTKVDPSIFAKPKS